MQAMIAITLNRHESEIIRQFEEGIREIPNVRACYHLTGRFDYMLYVGAEDIHELGRLVKTKIAELPGFGMSETFVIFSEIKSAKSGLICNNQRRGVIPLVMFLILPGKKSLNSLNKDFFNI